MLSLMKLDELGYSGKTMIPNFQNLMLPVLKAANKGITRNHDIISFIANEFELTDEERETLLPSKTQRTFDNRVYWAISYLKQAGLLKHLARGVIEITDIGKKVLAEKPERIDIHFLYKFSAFREFIERKSANGTERRLENNSAENSATPDEVIRMNYKQLNDALAAELLERIHQANPQFFEQLLIDLLLAMGYGGTWEDAGRAIGKTNDGGLDGVIDQDPLGVDQIYIQAKRYAENNSIGSDMVRNFIGALDGKRANKGLFVTTSVFSHAARQTADQASKRIILIDGHQLAKLMIRYNIGCRDEETIHIKKIDEDFFD